MVLTALEWSIRLMFGGWEGGVLLTLGRVVKDFTSYKLHLFPTVYYLLEIHNISSLSITHRFFLLIAPVIILITCSDTTCVPAIYDFIR